MWTVFALLLALPAVFAEDIVDPDVALHNPDLFQGDILGIDPDEDFNAISSLDRRWYGGSVSYAIDPSLAHIRPLIEKAIKHYEDNTCIKFRENKMLFGNYINFFLGNGCYSYVGIFGGKQPLSLGNGCHHLGIIIHEIGHALGFYHEQSRSDRDDYINIYWQNIKAGMAGQFKILAAQENTLYNRFDYESIMIYGEYAFSKDGKSKTMEDKNKIHKLSEPYTKQSMTVSDIERVNKLYDCKK